MWSIVEADLRLWLRMPQAVLVSVLVPLVVLILPALAGTVGTGYTVAVVDDQPAEIRAALMTSPYLRTVVMSRADAAVAIARGEVAGAFDSVGSELILSVAPYGNDDVRRNLVMRQQAVLAELNVARLIERDVPHVVLKERGLLQSTPTDQAYLAAGALVFAGLFSGLANTAYVTAREWEQRTIRGSLTSPVPVCAVLGSKLLTGTLQSLLGVAVAYGFVTLALDVLPVGNPWLLAAALLATVAGSGSLGLVVGVRFGKTVPAVLFSVVVSLAAWFVGGGFAPITLEPPELQTLARVLPPTYALAAGQHLVNGGSAVPVLAATTGIAGLSVIVALAVSTTMVRRVGGAS